MVAKTLVPTGEILSEQLRSTGEDVNLPAGEWVCTDDIKNMLKEQQKKEQEKAEYDDTTG